MKPRAAKAIRAGLAAAAVAKQGHQDAARFEAFASLVGFGRLPGGGLARRAFDRATTEEAKRKGGAR